MKPKLILILLLLVLLQSFSGLAAQTEEELLEKLETAEQVDRAGILNELAHFNLDHNFAKADEYALQASLIAKEMGQDDQLAYALYNRGVALLRMMRLDMAETLLFESLELFQTLGDTEKKGRANSQLAELNFRKNNYEESLRYSLATIAIWEELRDTRNIIQSMTNQSHIHNAMGQTDLAIQILEDAVTLHDRVLSDLPKTSLYLNLSRNYRVIGSGTIAYEYAQKALVEALKENQPLTLIDVYTSLSILYTNRGNYEQSYIYLSRALEQSRLIESVFHEAIVLNNIGNNFSRGDDYQRALGFYRESHRLFSDLEHSNGMITSVNNIGLMFENLSQPDSALVYYLRGVELSEQINNPSLLAQSYNYTGNIYRILGQFERSLSFIERAYEISVQIRNVNEQAKSASHLTTLFLAQGDYNQALAHARESLQLSKQIESVGLVQLALSHISDIHERLQQHEQSLSYFKQLTALKDSLANANREEQVAAIQEQLNLELKEREIENANLLLAQQALIVSRTQERFTFLAVLSVLVVVILLSGFSWYRLNQSRQKLLMEQKYIETEHRLLRSQMNPHFMFNALNSIQLYISEKDSKQAEKYLSKFAHLMRYYLDSSFTSNVLLKDEMNGLRLNIELEHLRLNKSFAFDVQADDDLEPEETEIPPMLAQPFIENAIKHGLRTKSTGGKLHVRYEQAGDGVMRCIVEDNGIGRAAAAALKRPTNGHTSRGIEITTNRLRNIWKDGFRDDHIKIIDLMTESGGPAGTRVELLFPYKY